MGFLVDIALPLALAFIMLGLGLGLTFGDFVYIARHPRAFSIGALSQVVLLPVIAFIFASLWPLTPELSLGLMIIAAAPGGATSNILTSLARGDVALSISLTATTSLLSVITIPIIVAFSYGQFMGERAGMDISVTGTAIGVFLIVVVPVLIGLFIRRFAGNFVLRVEPLVRAISIVLFILVIAGAIYQERANLIPYFSLAGPVTLVFNVTMMAIAYFLAKILAMGTKQRTAITMECGLQNGTLAIAVAVLLFGSGPAVIPATIYSLIMFMTAFLYIAVLRRMT